MNQDKDLTPVGDQWAVHETIPVNANNSSAASRRPASPIEDPIAFMTILDVQAMLRIKKELALSSVSGTEAFLGYWSYCKALPSGVC